MFGALNQERRNRQLNRFNNQLIREAVLDAEVSDNLVVLDESAYLLDSDNTQIPEEQLNQIENKVSQLLLGVDTANIDEQKLEEISEALMSSLDDIQIQPKF